MQVSTVTVDPSPAIACHVRPGHGRAFACLSACAAHTSHDTADCKCMQARTVICVLEREGVRGGLARELRAIGTRVACGSARRPVRSEGRSGRRERVLLAGSATGRSLCARGTSPATRQTQAHALPLNARRVRIWRTSANLRAPGPGGVSLHSHTAATAHQPRARARMPTDPAPDIGPDRASTSLHCGSAPPSGTQHNPGQHAGRGQCAELLHDCKSGSRVFLFS